MRKDPTRTAALALVVAAYLALAISPAPAQTGEAVTDLLAAPPEASADPAAALARADDWMDEWEGDSTVLEAARIEIERVLEANPNSAEAHRRHSRYLVSRAMNNSRDYEADGLNAAAKAADRALELEPSNAAAQLQRARIYRHQRQLAAARAALERATRLGASGDELHREWADLLMAENKPEQALLRCGQIERAGRASRDSADHCAIGPLWALRRFDELDRRHRAIVERAPESAWAHGNRARFQLCTGRGAKAAAESAARALSLMDYGHARLTLAASLYAQWAEMTNAGARDASEPLWSRAIQTMSGAPANIVASACHVGFEKPVLKALRDTRRGPLLMPVQAVMMAAEAAPAWLPGVFVLKVQGGGRGRGLEDGYVFLNSESDYRDPRSITVRLTPEAALAYQREHGTAADTALRNKVVVVYGYARQARIDFVQFGVPSGKYYFQTHIVVSDADQISVHDPAAPPPAQPPPVLPATKV